MRQFLISDQQIQFIASKLQELPAKYVYEAIRLFESLPEHAEKKEEVQMKEAEKSEEIKQE